ncbi:MAG: 5'-3' exonuclease H3TH domain-containing protein [Pseudomonadota bacterium]
MSEHRAWLIDSSIYIFRAWFSLPERWHDARGMPLNAVYGYVSFLLDFIEQARFPRHCAAAFDESLGSCFRNDLYPAYKASRELPDEALAFQLTTCKELTATLGLPCYGGPRFEADDYIASIARLCHHMDIPITVVTRDKDLGQVLLASEDHWYDFADGRRLDAAGFADKHGVRPEFFADYLALVGDKIDDIPGVPGVGPKTAAALCAAYGNLEGIEANMDSLAELPVRGAKGLRDKLVRHWPQLELARELTRLAERIPEIQHIPRSSISRSSLQALAHALDELGLGSALSKRCAQLDRMLAL